MMPAVAGSPARSVNESVRGPPPAAAEVAKPLALVHRPAPPGDRPERLTGNRIVAADLEAERAGLRPGRIRRRPGGSAWLPGGQLADLIGERLWVARKLECLNGQDRRRRVVAVAAPPGREPGDDHVGPEGADDPHDVRYDRPRSQIRSVSSGFSKSRSRRPG